MHYSELEKSLKGVTSDPIRVAFILAICSFGALAGDVVGEKIMKFIFKHELELV